MLNIFNRLKSPNGKSLPCLTRLHILSLDNFPLLQLHCTYMVIYRVYCPSYPLSQLTGRTHQVSLQNYCAKWDMCVNGRVRIPIIEEEKYRTEGLGPCFLEMRIMQLLNGKSTPLGHVRINLAQYVGGNEHISGPRRYRLQGTVYPRATLLLDLSVEPENTQELQTKKYRIPPLDRSLLVPNELDLLEILKREQESRRRQKRLQKNRCHRRENVQPVAIAEINY
ncbi:uncharacterized protein VTP21DRAFT_9105 [Calcarisporiella thermophila]|uniref:uncharacterized protein n=1 Tax=Calcarisporiella thermophila TaxID=911321 RepID=UPI003743EA73